MLFFVDVGVQGFFSRLDHRRELKTKKIGTFQPVNLLVSVIINHLQMTSICLSPPSTSTSRLYIQQNKLFRAPFLLVPSCALISSLFSQCKKNST